MWNEELVKIIFGLKIKDLRSRKNLSLQELSKISGLSVSYLNEIENGKKYFSMGSVVWFTNMDIAKRHEELILYKNYSPMDYPKYDNYNGINVDKVAEIPKDYSGAMGVPITFLDKYNPEQFEIIKFRKGDDEKDLTINGKSPYFRILIRNKKL
ncbi:MAG: helix-turn-helix domain-containing protein [Ignavibacteria bacterium]|nr:helix-turn-helix domain-containing protein [Ignavibacteria bacterium]